MTPLDTLRTLRLAYPTPMTDDQRGELLNRTAWLHRAEGWGLLKKPSGAHVLQPQTGIEVSGDILCRIEGVNLLLFDVLIHGEGDATPTWGKKKPLQDLHRWIAPVDPSGVSWLPDTPDSPPVIVPPWNDAQAVQFGQAVNEVYREVGPEKIDAGMIAVHAGRITYSHYISKMPWSQAFAKHVAEFRAVYGLS